MNLTVVIAPDSFKGTVGAADAAAALALGWSAARPRDTILQRPMADGGEGTLAAFERAVTGSRRVPEWVTGPDDRIREAFWLLLPPDVSHPNGTGVVERASTSGIELLARLRPMSSHTRGFGESIAAALATGVDRLILGIGSSASTDGGTGMLAALGASFLDADGRPVPAGTTGLEVLRAVEMSGLAPLPPGGVDVLTDVTNPLTGPHGAAAVFGPQKGATAAEVARMDAGLARLAALVPTTDAAATGAGAAGGTGFALLAWGARLRSGAAGVAELIRLPEAVAEASVVITGEGSFDASSASGKAPALVAALAAGAGVPAVLIAGRIEGDPAGFAQSVSLTELAGSPSAAIAEPARWLKVAGRRVADEMGTVRLAGPPI